MRVTEDTREKGDRLDKYGEKQNPNETMPVDDEAKVGHKHSYR